MEVSDILSGATTVTPTSSSKAFPDRLLPRWCDVVSLHHWKGGEGVKGDRIKQMCPRCRCWGTHGEWLGSWAEGPCIWHWGHLLKCPYILQLGLIFTGVFES